MTATLLLIEDDDDARQSLTRSLERAGHLVLSGSSVDEGIQLVDRGAQLTVVVSDMVLGDEDAGGIRMIRELRQRQVSAPVILITAFAGLQNVKMGLNEGAAFLLEKPFRAVDLLAAISRAIEARPGLGHTVDAALISAGLTDKEQVVARLVLKGLTSSEIARLEQNSDKTVRQHITRIYQKCGVTSRAEFFNHVFPW
jgi:DNA-binding NarL/FixJ family response regulator